MAIPCHTLTTHQVPGVAVYGEGVVKAVAASVINFVGTGVAVSATGTHVTVTLPSIVGPQGPAGAAGAAGGVGPQGIPGLTGPAGSSAATVRPTSWVWNTDKMGGAVLGLSDGTTLTIPAMPTGPCV
jgi:hypothetical protein